MKMRTVEIAVGGFMVAGIVSLLMLSLQVSGLSTIYKKEGGYNIQAEFSNIGGLKIRSKVSIAGVVIGRVVGIDLDQGSYNAKVTMAIQDAVRKLPLDTRASILTAGLLGDNFVGLSPGFNEEEYLKEGSVIAVENTDSALALEQLISKFVAGKASGE